MISAYFAEMISVRMKIIFMIKNDSVFLIERNFPPASNRTNEDIFIFQMNRQPVFATVLDYAMNFFFIMFEKWIAMFAKTVPLPIGFGKRFKPADVADIGIVDVKAFDCVENLIFTFFAVVIQMNPFFLYLMILL